MRLITPHLTLQPGLRELPVAHHGRRRHIQHGRGFLHGQAAEESHLDDPTLSIVELCQRFQRLVERDEVRRALVRDDECFIERHLRRVTAALLVVPRAGMVHKDVPHDTGRHGQKMCAILPRDGFRVDQPEIGLVDERRGLKAVVDPLAPDVALRDAMQLLVNQRDEALQRILVSLSPFEQQAGDLGGVSRNTRV